MSGILLLHAHSDDIPLWMSFSALKWGGDMLGVTMFDSFVQPSRGFSGCDWLTRRKEDEAAFEILGVTPRFAGFRDDMPDWDGVKGWLVDLRRNNRFDQIYIPAIETGGHEHHNELGRIAGAIWPEATRCLSYTKAGKSRSDKQVPCNGEMIYRKMQALCCYKSQITIDGLGCAPHFLRDQYEYYQ